MNAEPVALFEIANANTVYHIHKLAQIITIICSGLELEEEARNRQVSYGLECVSDLSGLWLDVAKAEQEKDHRRAGLGSHLKAFLKKVTNAIDLTRLVMAAPPVAQAPWGPLKQCWQSVAASALKLLRLCKAETIAAFHPQVAETRERVLGLLFKICADQPLQLNHMDIKLLSKQVESRKNRRYSSKSHCTVWVANRPVRVECLDESDGGCCIALDLPVAAGERIVIQTMTGLRFNGEVRWQCDGKTGVSYLA